MKKIGVKQECLVKLGCKKGYVTCYDARIVYDMSASYRPKYYDIKRKAMQPLVELEKLENYGYLKKDGNCFIITELGKEYVKTMQS